MTLRDTLKQALPLAFGVSGPLASPLMTEHKVKRLIRGAQSQGITVFDTSPSYGKGQAERRLAKALDPAGTVFLMTKAGNHAGGQRDFSPGAIVQSVGVSLKRLRRPHIDLLWLHGPAARELTPTLINQLSELKEAGKVRHFGVAGRNTDLLAACDEPLFEALMLPVHEGLSEDGQGLLSACRRSEKMIFAIEVLQGLAPTSRRLTAGSVWRTARRLAGRSAVTPSSSTSAETSFAEAYRLGADIIVSSTTSQGHLRQNITFARAHATQP